MQTSGSSQNANGSYAQMTMLANTAIAAAVEHRHRRRPDTTLVATKSITFTKHRGPIVRVSKLPVNLAGLSAGHTSVFGNVKERVTGVKALHFT